LGVRCSGRRFPVSSEGVTLELVQKHSLDQPWIATGL